MVRVVEQFQRRAVAKVVLTLPFPPSMNRLWRVPAGGGKPYRSDRYRTWIRAAGNELKAQRPGRVAGPFAIVVEIGRPDRRKRDADNALKAVLDLLEAHRVIDNDSLQRRTTVQWTEGIVGARVTVTAWDEAARVAA